MAEDSALDRLCDYVGLETSYWDVAGVHHEVPRRSKKKLLAAMGYGANTEQAAADTLKALRAERNRRMLAPVAVLREGGAFRVRLGLTASELEGGLAWQIKLEDGGARSGRAAAEQLTERDGNGAVMLCLPADLPHGYHELSIETAGRSAWTRLIVAPRRAFLPEAMRGTGVWGLALQLYSLR
ncbi:MAG: hypothetical protein C0605_09130, partial [Hyphomicrobiales bacterium]